MLGAIRIAFEGDEDIKNFCDPSVKDMSIEEITHSVHEKIEEYLELGIGEFEQITKDDKVIGFIFYAPLLLISFGINKYNRDRETLSLVFERIVDGAGDGFSTFMWERNSRAITWLERCGMTRDKLDMEGLTKLNYKRCQQQ